MNKCLLILLVILNISVSAQERINFIIEVNDELLESGVTNAQIQIGSKSYFADYNPGELLLTDSLYSWIMSDSLEFRIKFDFYDHSKRTTEVLNVSCPLSWFTLSQPYQILKVYNLTDNKYRRWYGHLTKEDFLCEVRFPNSGILIRNK